MAEVTTVTDNILKQYGFIEKQSVIQSSGDAVSTDSQTRKYVIDYILLKKLQNHINHF